MSIFASTWGNKLPFFVHTTSAFMPLQNLHGLSAGMLGLRIDISFYLITPFPIKSKNNLVIITPSQERFPLVSTRGVRVIINIHT